MEQSSEKYTYLVIDGLNVFLRHFFANTELNNKSEPVGGITGFMKSLDKLITLFSPNKMFVIWETGGGSPRRKHIYKEYKGNRNKQRKFDLDRAGAGPALTQKVKVQQLVTLNKFLKHTPICQVYVSGTEADDIISYLVKDKFHETNVNRIIVSNDKDFYQLVNDNIVIYDPGKKIVIDQKYILKEYGISPINFCLARALVGDASDNIKGVPRIGLKTALRRFQALGNPQTNGTIDGILDECKKLATAGEKSKIYSSVLENEDIVRRNWKLMLLSSGNMPAQVINKVNYVVDTHEPKMNKLGLYKDMLEAGISVPFEYNSMAMRMRNSMVYRQ